MTVDTMNEPIVAAVRNARQAIAHPAAGEAEHCVSGRGLVIGLMIMLPIYAVLGLAVALLG